MFYPKVRWGNSLKMTIILIIEKPLNSTKRRRVLEKKINKRSLGKSVERQQRKKPFKPFDKIHEVCK